jgi:hypothetical protein
MRIALSASLAAVLLSASALPARGEDMVTESFFLDLPTDGIAVTHDGKKGLGTGPPGIALLAEPALADSLALLVKLRDAQGNVVGFASELEVFPAGRNPVLEDNVVWDTDWTLVIPGRGTLYLRQKEISHELGSRIIRPVEASGKPWEGEWTVTTTVGPRADGWGEIVGGAGEFAGVTGRFLEIDTLTGFQPGGVMIGHMELRLEIRHPRQ